MIIPHVVNKTEEVQYYLKYPYLPINHAALIAELITCIALLRKGSLPEGAASTLTPARPRAPREREREREPAKTPKAKLGLLGFVAHTQ